MPFLTYNQKLIIKLTGVHFDIYSEERLALLNSKAGVLDKKVYIKNPVPKGIC